MWVTATTSPLAYDCTETTGLRTALCWIRCRRIHRCSLIRDQTWWSPPGRRLAEIIKSLNDSLAHQSVFLFLTLRVWNKPSASRGSLIVYLLLARKCFPVVFPTWVFHYWKMCFLVEVGSESEALLLKMYILSFFFFSPQQGRHHLLLQRVGGPSLSPELCYITLPVLCGQENAFCQCSV